MWGVCVVIVRDMCIFQSIEVCMYERYSSLVTMCVCVHVFVFMFGLTHTHTHTHAYTLSPTHMNRSRRR